MLNKIHLFAAIIATLCIAIFFCSTVIIELFASSTAISTVKSLIVTPGLFILVPAMMAVGSSGFLLAKNKKGRLVENKKKRMLFIVVNGLFILIPAAIFLDKWAFLGAFDAKFYIVQGIELLAGVLI